jgi:hypothetical protein
VICSDCGAELGRAWLLASDGALRCGRCHWSRERKGTQPPPCSLDAPNHAESRTVTKRLLARLCLPGTQAACSGYEPQAAENAAENIALLRINANGGAL